MKTRTTIFIIIVWIILISFSTIWNIESIDKNIDSIARIQGQSFFEEIVNARAWNAEHGGVYVPITDDTQPNPYLETTNREIYIDSLGLSLTKINPAYMTRQISEIAEQKSNIKYHITSLNPIRPKNKADKWESLQLHKFEKGEIEAFEFQDQNSVYRYMAPLKVDESCMQCHEKQGYKIGDIRGGISVSINANNFLRSSNEQKRNIYIIHFALLLIGIFVIVFFQNYSLKQYLRVQKANETISQKNKILNKNEIKLKEITKQLKQLNDTKDRMFSIIAHDLRNSFSSILGFSELLITLNHEKQYKKFEVYTGHIKNSTQNAHTLLTNLLDWARLQTGSLKYDPDLFDMNKVLEEVLAFADVSAFQKKITITNSIPQDLKVYGDKNMINTILRNLISNAIKYSNINGKVDVKAILQNKIVEFSVKDNGIGMKEEDIDKLFKIDVNYTTKGTLDEKGTGLGLILCKDFVELHEGKIWIESEFGKGTTVKFNISGHNTGI